MNAPVSDIKVRMWSPAVPLKAPDNIVSSQFTLQKVFVPSYEKEKRPCMEQLLTNEYQRIWWQEKETWDRRFNAMPTTKKLLQRKDLLSIWHSYGMQYWHQTLAPNTDPNAETDGSVFGAKVIKKKSSRETAKELPKKIKKPRRKIEPKKTGEESKKSKATEVVATETTDEKQQDKEK